MTYGLLPEPDWATCTEEVLWPFVAAHLAADGIPTVLVGGAVAAIYSHGGYRSGDLDLVIEGRAIPPAQLTTSLAKIGFTKQGRHFRHPLCPQLFIEFVPGPVAIGNDFRIALEERQVSGQTIRLLAPTECVKDRLASFTYFRSRECLEQALLVASACPVDQDRLQTWATREGAEARLAYNEFLNLLQSRTASEPPLPT
jgi:hypothetical protein